MATAMELCAQLGFLDDFHEGPSRGTPKVLLDEMRVFVKKRIFVQDPDLMAKLYLDIHEAGEKHLPVAGIPLQGQPLSGGDLAWPVDRDRIKELVALPFDLLIRNVHAEPSVIDLKDAESGPANKPNAQQAVVDSQGLLSAEPGKTRSEARPSENMASRAPDPITKLAQKDPDLIWNLLDAGYTEPFPVIAKSQEHLVLILNEWMQSHPGKDPPGAKPLQTQYCGYKHTYRKVLTLASTSEYVWVERFKISEDHMGWILKDGDGSCMLVINHGNGGNWRGYHGWLGADLGFTTLTIAHTGLEVRDVSAMDVSDDSLEEYPHGVRAARTQQQFGHSEDTPRATLEDNATKIVSKDQETARPDSVIIKKEPTRSEVRRRAMRRNQMKHQRDENRWRVETPPLSSLGAVKKFCWPPQYVPPPPTTPLKEPRLHITTELRTQSTTPVAPGALRDRSSSPELISVGPANALLGTRRSARITNTARYNTKPPPRTSQKTKIATPQFPISPTSTVVNPQTPISPALTSTPTQPTSPDSTIAASAIIHFFLSDEGLGALPVALAQCSTIVKFFDRAEATWRFLGSQSRIDHFAGVRVIFEGIQWLMIVGWKDSAGYQWMMNTISKATTNKVQDLHAQIKCIAK